MATTFKTQLLHLAHNKSEHKGSVSVPLYQTTAFDFGNSDHAADVFNLTAAGYIYTRLNNPTTDVLEQRIAALEGGVGAVVTSCGMSAISTTLLTLLRAGDNIVASTSLYGGTYNLLSVTLPRLGITTTFVDADDFDALDKAITDNTKVVYVESLGNPKLDFVDIRKVADIAHKHDLPLIVDNTTTPSVFRPIEHGADIVIHSLSKYICGNGSALAGAVIDSGRFNWANGKFPEFTNPSPGYHGLVYSETFGSAAFIVKLRVEGLRDLGGAVSPYNSLLLIQGLETLDVRFERISNNALKVAQWLEKHELVEWVNYPGLESSKYHDRCKSYINGGFGGLLTFGIKGGYEAAKKFSDSTEIFAIVANLGDTKSLIIHPASTTHRQLSEEQQLSAGVTPSLVRISLGLEHIDDLINDLSQALEKCKNK